MGFGERRIWALMKAWREARGTEKQMLCQSSHECKSVCAERIRCMTRISTPQSTAKGIFHVRCHWSSRLLAYQSLSQPSYAGVTSVLTWPRISLWHVPMIRKQLLFWTWNWFVSSIWTLFFMFGNALDSGHWQKRKSVEGRCDCILDEDTKEHPSMQCTQMFYQKGGQKCCRCLDLVSIVSVIKTKWMVNSKRHIAQIIVSVQIRTALWAP